jgi:hypothetical protein
MGITNLKLEQFKSYFYHGICVFQVSFISVLRATVLAKVGGKLPLCLSKQNLKEIYGNWSYSSTHLYPQHQMEENC